MKLTLHEIGQVVHATNDYQTFENITLAHVEFDSRKVTADTLFVPLQGQSDGHDYIDMAEENGATATFWSKEEAPNIPYLQVDNTLEAMQRLAIYYRQKVNPKVVAITGSNGKTTTKDMTAAVASAKFNTYKTQGNYNNNIGMPYTMLAMPEETEVLVLEMGMDGAHQIDQLSEMATPDVAAITLIGESHIENLGNTRAGIANAKLEILTGLNPHGTLIVPSDEPLISERIQNIQQNVVTFGLNKDATIYGAVQNVYRDCTTFTTSEDNDMWEIPVIGDYNVKNALIAIAVGEWLEIDLDCIHKALAHFQLTQNRTEWLTAKNGASILSDVYNANPTAMNLVLDNVSTLEEPTHKIAVLGDMLELGEQSQAMHESVATHLNPETIQDVVLYGPMMAHLYEALQGRYDDTHLYYFAEDEQEALIATVKKILTTDSMVVLKASNGMKLLNVVHALQAEK